MSRTIAILDSAAVLTGRIEAPTDEEWENAPPHLRFESGFDNALKRYRLVQWKPGKWRFEPIVHAKDGGEENVKSEIRIVPILARIAAGCPRPGDTGALAEYLRTFDGAI